jgi:hypothetical protein
MRSLGLERLQVRRIPYFHRARLLHTLSVRYSRLGLGFQSRFSQCMRTRSVSRQERRGEGFSRHCCGAGTTRVEHRWGQRVVLDQPVRLEARPGWTALGVLREASLSGGYVKTTVQLSTGARLHLELDWIYWSRAERCRIPAYVVRMDEHGIAVEWCDFAPASIELLISSHAGTSEAARQERLLGKDVASRPAWVPLAAPAERSEQP